MSPPLAVSAKVLILALLALAAVFVAWFMRDANPWVALAVFALPPFLLAIGRWRRHRTAGYWASVLGLFWFSHGVMVAWSRPGERGYAWAELVLALVIIFAASWPGVHARFTRKRA